MLTIVGCINVFTVKFNSPTQLSSHKIVIAIFLFFHLLIPEVYVVFNIDLKK